MAETRHIRARIKGFGVIDLAPGVLHHCLGIAAQLAVVVEARSQRSMGDFLFANLVTVVTVTPIGRIGLIAIGTASTVLGKPLSRLPVA